MLHELQSPSGDGRFWPRVKIIFHGKCHTDTTFWVSNESGLVPGRLFTFTLWVGNIALTGRAGLADGPVTSSVLFKLKENNAEQWEERGIWRQVWDDTGSLLRLHCVILNKWTNFSEHLP